MRSPYNFLIEPKGDRYDNVVELEGGGELIVNTEIQNHQFVSRQAIVKGVPSMYDIGVQIGDTVIVHHNVFRRFHNARGVEVNSKSYFMDDLFIVGPDQIFMYNRNDGWKPLPGYCFVKPLKNTDELSAELLEKHVGEMKYCSEEQLAEGITPGTVVGFAPHSEYEFIIDDEKLYRVLTDKICILYGPEYYQEVQGDN